MTISDPRHEVFAQEYVAAGGKNLVAAARAAGLTSPGRRDANHWREAVRVLREEGVQTYILERLHAVGGSVDLALSALVDALSADKIEQNFSKDPDSGPLVNLGPDHKVRADAAEKLLRAALGLGYNQNDKSKFGQTKVEIIYPTRPLNANDDQPAMVVIEHDPDE